MTAVYVSMLPSLALWMERGILPEPGEFHDQAEPWARAAIDLHFLAREETAKRAKGGK